MGQSLPNFSAINLDSVEKELEIILNNNLSDINKLLEKNTVYTWDNLMQPMEELNDKLHHFWSPIQHMNGVINSPKLREVINNCLPKLSDYSSEISQNETLFHAVESIDIKNLDIAQQKTIENDIRNFKLAGVNLPKAEQEKFAALSKSLSQLTQKFEENVLDATMGFKKVINNPKELSGIPEHAVSAAKLLAEKENKSGWIFSLEAPSYLAVMMYADSQSLREAMYTAFVTRASDQGPNANKWNNDDVMREILEKRFELAKLLGFKNYAEYSLQTKMVKKTEDVLNFLSELAEKSLPSAQKEFQQLSEFAKSELKIEKLNAWDVAYASEKLSQQLYQISQEDLRPYFPEPKVLTGLFSVIQKLYHITVKPELNVNLWHKDASCFNLFDSNNKLQARLFIDLYARENKRGGAWMDDCRARRKLLNGEIQIPVAYVTCNFNAPAPNQPALFTHDDVITLFHETGHALQHMLTKINIASVSGINGIPWDAVEVASQFFENWAWEKASIDLFAEHFQTKSKLPNDLFEKLIRAKNFQSAMQMMRQVEFALFDFDLHMHFDANNLNSIQVILNHVREKTSVVPVPTFNRFQNSFSHIFAGGYAAGYYSYKWAEVMACDAFSLFLQNGIFDAKTAEKFKTTFLESGGAKEPMDLFIEFRGRKPQVDALLEQNEII